MKKKVNIFYIISVIYLLITLMVIFTTYQGLNESASNYNISLADEWLMVIISIINSSAIYLGLSFIFYGMGVIIEKMDTNIISLEKRKRK